MISFYCDTPERYTGFFVQPPCGALLLAVDPRVNLNIEIECPYCGEVKTIAVGTGVIEK